MQVANGNYPSVNVPAKGTTDTLTGVFLFCRRPSKRLNMLSKARPYKGLEVTPLDDLLDLICWLAPLFYIWYKLWEHVYFREDDEE